MALVDTHCHLYSPPLAGAVDSVLTRAAARDVTRVIVPAYDAASWPTTAALAARPDLFAAYGLHPWLAHDLPDEMGRAGEGPPGDPPTAAQEGPPGGPRPNSAARTATQLADFRGRLTDCLAAHPHVAVGEIGLDTKIETSGLDQQLPLLRTQLELAVDRELPVILHCRGAFAELLLEIQRFGGRLRGVLHAFSRGPELAQQFTHAGLHLGLGGAITRDRAKRVRRAAQLVPLEWLVLETDAPSIGLDGVLPEQTEPQHVADIAAALAELRGEPLATIAEATTGNAERLFDLTT